MEAKTTETELPQPAYTEIVIHYTCYMKHSWIKNIDIL